MKSLESEFCAKRSVTCQNGFHSNRSHFNKSIIEDNAVRLQYNVADHYYDTTLHGNYLYFAIQTILVMSMSLIESSPYLKETSSNDLYGK